LFLLSNADNRRKGSLCTTPSPATLPDFERAQALADAMKPDELHRRLDRYAKRYCPVLDELRQRYHRSLMQVEYSTDLVFRSEAVLRPLYEQLSREAVLAVKAEQVAGFLGKKITPSSRRRWAVSSPRASRAPASNTASARPG
jgi:chromosome condensin MukBEF ATPase and DNA-binding subunit MukB